MTPVAVYVVVGIGATSTASVSDCLAVLDDVVPTSFSIGALSTLASKEIQMLPVAASLGVTLHLWSAEELAAVTVTEPSVRTQAATGTPSVAEAAALRAAGGRLVLAKTSARGVTVAAALL